MTLTCTAGCRCQRGVGRLAALANDTCTLERRSLRSSRSSGYQEFMSDLYRLHLCGQPAFLHLCSTAIRSIRMCNRPLLLLLLLGIHPVLVHLNRRAAPLSNNPLTDPFPFCSPLESSVYIYTYIRMDRMKLLCPAGVPCGEVISDLWENRSSRDQAIG